jgi:hypothetical protein
MTVLTDTEWRAIVKAIPPGNDLERARRELEQCIRDYRGLRLNREKLLEARKQARHVAETTTAPSLESIRQKASRTATALDTLVRARKGKRNPERDWLYWRLMQVWTDSFGKALAITAGGRLVRFLGAAVEIATGNAPSDATMRTVIRRERERRQWHEAQRHRANQPVKKGV